MRRCEDVKMRRCEKMWEDVRRWEDVKMRWWEDVRMWRWEDVKMRRCEDEKMWEDVRRCEKMRRCGDEKMWRWEEDEMWRWEDVLQTPTIGRTLRSDALGKMNSWLMLTIYIYIYIGHTPFSGTAMSDSFPTAGPSRSKVRDSRPPPSNAAGASKCPGGLGDDPRMSRLKLRPVVDRWLTYPSENMKVRWDIYSQYIYIYIYVWKNRNSCSKPPTSKS